MEPRNRQLNIQIVNCSEDSIPGIETSRFYDHLHFTPLDSNQDLFSMDTPSDIVVVFVDKQDCLDKIAKTTRTMTTGQIIAAVTCENTDAGVRALQSGAADFMILPAKTATFDLYISRAIERTYLQDHCCFNDSCYKSQLARSQNNYQQLFNEVPCFIYVQDADYQITDANRKFEAYFGNHIGEYCFGICKNRDEPCRACPAQKTFKDGANHASEMEIISSDGVKHVVLSWTAPIRDPQGNISNVLVMLTDITEARRLEDHLTSLGFMIGSISHGIKGLLTNLDGGLYLMDSGFKSKNPEKISQGFDLSRDMASRIKNLVLDILYYTKTRTLEREKISCRAFMEDTLKIVSMKAQKHHITLQHRLEVLTGDDRFEIDNDSLQAALINILENGIDACVDDKSGRDHSILFTARVDQEKVLFRIQDNGLGMTPAALKNIFTIFFSSKGNKGTGLGLFIANKVIAQHHGEIKVKSTKKQGTRFLIKIPRTIPLTARNPREVAL